MIENKYAEVVEIQLRVRPKWRRVFYVPKIWYQQYTIFRRYYGRIKSARASLSLIRLLFV